jgi:predicted transcriptional regulator
MRRTRLTEDIMRAVEDSELTLKQIARKAGIPYDTLQRFTGGRQKKLDVNHAEKLWFALSGRRFTR